MCQNGAFALSLTLFVFWILLVNHVNAALATNNFVVGTAFFDTGTNFHVTIGCLLWPTARGAWPFLVIAYLLRQ